MTGLSITALLTIAMQGAAQARPPLKLLNDFGPSVSAEWLHDHLNDPGLVVVQVGYHTREYDRGHIPGAYFLRHQDLAPEQGRMAAEAPDPKQLMTVLAGAGIGEGARVVFYGEPMAAARAWATLDWFGLGDRAAVLDGGLGAWRRLDLPLSADVPVRGATLPMRAGPAGPLVDTDWVAEHLRDTAIVLIDARPDDEYTGADGGHGGAHLAGHIPGARQLYWEDLLVSTTDRRLRPRAELEARFRRAGARRGKTLVVYCMIGLRASVVYHAARLLGYDVRFYDGSWQEWSYRGLSVETGRPEPKRLPKRPAPAEELECSPAARKAVG
ncbi:MAG: sulfurtransferase [Gemmatimonadales bacterium]